jgi:hypothetical protein
MKSSSASSVAVLRRIEAERQQRLREAIRAASGGPALVATIRRINVERQEALREAFNAHKRGAITRLLNAAQELENWEAQKDTPSNDRATRLLDGIILMLLNRAIDHLPWIAEHGADALRHVAEWLEQLNI